MALGANLTENGLVRIASGTALAMRAGLSRDVMEVHRMLAHPTEDITRKTAEMMGIETTGQWGACETCFQAKAKRHAVPKKTDEWARVRGQRFFVDVGGPMKHSSLGGNSYVVIFVDDCTRFKVVKFVKKKSDTTAALLSMIADYITPQKLSIKCVRTDNGGDFEEEFQRELDRRSITHAHTPPDTPQYNEVAKRALGLLREEAIILMEALDNVITCRERSCGLRQCFSRATSPTSQLRRQRMGVSRRTNYGLKNSLLPIICDRLERWDTRDGTCVHIRWRRKERNAYSWEFPATSPLAR